MFCWVHCSLPFWVSKVSAAAFPSQIPGTHLYFYHNRNRVLKRNGTHQLNSSSSPLQSMLHLCECGWPPLLNSFSCTSLLGGRYAENVTHNLIAHQMGVTLNATLYASRLNVMRHLFSPCLCRRRMALMVSGGELVWAPVIPTALPGSCATGCCHLGSIIGGQARPFRFAAEKEFWWQSQ